MSASFPQQAAFERLDADARAALHQEAQAWAVRLKSGATPTSDIAAFHRWRDQSPAHAWAWSETSKNWKALAGLAGAFEQRNPGRVRRPDPVQRRRRFVFGGLAAGAAACGLGAVAVLHPPRGLWPSWPELQADFRTAKGEQRDMALGERTRLILNTQTSVSVLPAQADRTVRLSLIAGEAAVATQGVVCDVLAGPTQLSLTDGDVEIRRLPDGQVQAKCNRGRAELRHPGGSTMLLPGQSVRWDPHAGAQLASKPAADSAWREGWVVFNDLPLADVIAEINRYRAGRVVLVNQDLAARRFSAKFRTDALDDAVGLISQALSVKVVRMGDLVLFT
jgi:transmembrane sensor